MFLALILELSISMDNHMKQENLGLRWGKGKDGRYWNIRVSPSKSNGNKYHIDATSITREGDSTIKSDEFFSPTTISKDI